MGITLITDSTCDLSPAFLAERNILFAPLKVLFKDGEYIDKVDLTNTAFYEKMRSSETLPTTSQVNPNEFYEIFSEELQKGNQIIGVFLSSELSGTYNSAVVAKEMLNSDLIFLIDSRTASFSLGLMVMRLYDLIQEGNDAATIMAKKDDLVASAQLYGMLDTLDNLHKGGRLSAGATALGKMLNIKPIIEVQEGQVNVAHKARGSRKGIAWMIDQLENDYPMREIPDIAIANADAPELAETLKRELLMRFKIERIYDVEVGAVIGTHTGEGVVGIAYFK
ncbi:DegV family protein [Fusibacter paucivorans]|uniref:DegV family protein n=1 Tax=Fusibacter paucivorans TaxID=76009 RepID=A0ABS5PLQ0_9FIRM|nr:DegV family protein [Fusibacter paucivorans]MBS7526095.1 DegV family protein [Fusibacter paucivorans]